MPPRLNTRSPGRAKQFGPEPGTAMRAPTMLVALANAAELPGSLTTS